MLSLENGLFGCGSVNSAKYLHEDTTEWMDYLCLQVQQKHIPDEEVARAIASKLDDMSGVSYADIANGAFDGGRVKLALKVSHCGAMQ